MWGRLGAEVCGAGEGALRPGIVMRLLAALTCICLAGCAALGGNLVLRNTRPVVKIGLVAPFEGRYRALGYEVLYAVKWAIGEQGQKPRNTLRGFCLGKRPSAFSRERHLL